MKRVRRVLKPKPKFSTSKPKPGVRKKIRIGGCCGGRKR